MKLNLDRLFLIERLDFGCIKFYLNYALINIGIFSSFRSSLWDSKFSDVAIVWA